MAREALVIGTQADLESDEVRALIEVLGEPVSVLRVPPNEVWARWTDARTEEEWASKKANARAVVWVAPQAQSTWMLAQFPKTEEEVLEHEIVVTVHDHPFGVFLRFGAPIDVRKGVEDALVAAGLRGE